MSHRTLKSSFLRTQRLAVFLPHNHKHLVKKICTKYYKIDCPGTISYHTRSKTNETLYQVTSLISGHERRWKEGIFGEGRPVAVSGLGMQLVSVLMAFVCSQCRGNRLLFTCCLQYGTPFTHKFLHVFYFAYFDIIL